MNQIHEGEEAGAARTPLKCTIRTVGHLPDGGGCWEGATKEGTTVHYEYQREAETLERKYLIFLVEQVAHEFDISNARCRYEVLQTAQLAGPPISPVTRIC